MLEFNNLSNNLHPKKFNDVVVFDLIENNTQHFVYRRPLDQPVGDDISCAVFGMGCFWGVEKLFWTVPGVIMTAVGYSGGSTLSPDYKTVCTGATGHNEVVLVHFNEVQISFKELLVLFWEEHDPTQGMRQGNDIGSQYRSGIYTFREKDLTAAQVSKDHYSSTLKKEKFGEITTEIRKIEKFYYAEEYHQQYLAKNPNGYCGLKGTGVSFEYYAGLSQ